MDALHSRGYLPHFEAGNHPQFITFRLAGSVPASVLISWREELSVLPDSDAREQIARRIDRYLDQGHGNRILAAPDAAAVVENTLPYFDGTRYRLHAWVIMPNHVHVLVTPGQGLTLASMMMSWKSYTSHELNRLSARSGAVWQPEYFDRAIRDEDHFFRAMKYIHMNPVRAGLCCLPEMWPFSSARRSGEADRKSSGDD